MDSSAVESGPERGRTGLEGGPRLRCVAPAKINLGLRVVGRRGDGYHLLESLFVPLELADDVELRLRDRAGPGSEPGPESVLPRIRLELLADPEAPPGTGSVPADPSNLAVRAARAFFASAGGSRAGRRVAALEIRLRKRIPAAAGLGGGSSDAGAVLRGLAQLVPDGPPPPELARIALALGADVPFFLDPRAAWVRGIGEEIEPVPGLPALSLVLANPGISLSTAEVFRLYDGLQGRYASDSGGLTLGDPRSTMRALSGLSRDPKALSSLPGLQNDLEAAAVRLCPPVSRLRDRLRAAGALFAGMSGSGATVYGVFETEAAAHEARDRAGFDRTIWTCVTRLQPAHLQEARGAPTQT